MVALALEVRFLDQRYHGTPDWPPSPGRLFQALVAGAASDGTGCEARRAALHWFETLEAPVILAPRTEPGRAYISYVPNNDGDAEGDPTDPSRIGKRIQARLIAEDAPLIYLWSGLEAVPDGVADLAERLCQLGRGIDPAYARAVELEEEAVAALMADHPGSVHRPAGSGPDGLDCPLPGSLASLEARHEAFLKRLAVQGAGRKSRIEFSNPPRARFGRVRYDRAAERILFDLRDEKGHFWAIDAAHAGQLVSDWLKDAAERLGPTLAPLAERFVIGRGAGPRDLDRRIRAFALPTLRQHGDRNIRRLAVEIPPDCPIRRDDLVWALGGSADFVGKWGQPVQTEDHRMLERYCQASSRWQSEIPLALPVQRRRLSRGETKAGSERAREEAAARAAVATALRHAGVHAKVAAIGVRKEPYADQGVMAERFAQGTRFDKHSLWHAEVEFLEPVEGPLLLGNGRFAGLGLMRPAQDGAKNDILAFRILEGLEAPDAENLAQALRRAVMARCGANAPAFITGHENDGSPSRPGRNGHVAFVADLPRRRLLVIPPHLADHRAQGTGEDAAMRDLADALQGFTTLRAGRSGCLQLAADPVQDDDPLFCRARVWASVTRYQATHHPRGRPLDVVLKDDLSRELSRRGLPAAEVSVLKSGFNPGGGLFAHLRLTFSHPVQGPVLLGRTLHKGGGLFAAVMAPDR
ncbi:type I-U CRISPR-associated protein Csb2 (plasmid) [Cereibacter azotoformans]|uniref:CRISPR-associated protein Csb2 n=1 Tax=Cereibacter azotoformans TaxID=43057 RepID=A0A2T5JQ96_9RHOB|nr:type I-U CRISPR-associated protein Csb2 [Cereibacter azotoformans]PTR09908.1 CRISPR-associated protein Csb2 [Cereibacter azotoformans]UIJ33311.1 type I-U CRISPR-associated protein Csb2 [Cereibacter azotoformans]